METMFMMLGGTIDELIYKLYKQLENIIIEGLV